MSAHSDLAISSYLRLVLKLKGIHASNPNRWPTPGDVLSLGYLRYRRGGGHTFASRGNTHSATARAKSAEPKTHAPRTISGGKSAGRCVAKQNMFSLCKP